MEPQSPQTELISPGISWLDFSGVYVYLLVALLFYLTHLKIKKQRRQFSFRALVKFCFPLENYFNRSAAIDLFIYLFNTAFSLIPMAIWGILIMQLDPGLVNKNTQAGHFLDRLFDLEPSSYFIALLFFIVEDGLISYFHYFSHRNRFLWELHKVHHSATHMNLFTGFRHHPLIMAFGISISTPLSVLLRSSLIFSLIPWAKVTEVIIASLIISFVVRIYDVLKHTHIPLSLGWLDYVLQSPAMHQAHHSVDGKLQHKNFGAFFSFWDFLWGSFYLPPKDLKIEYGLKPAIRGNKRYDSFWGVLWDPLFRR